MKTNYEYIIIGGGTGGIMTAAQLLKKNITKDVAVIEPSETHYYQPAWTLVGAGAFNYEQTKKPMKDLIPSGADWIKDFVDKVEPAENTIVLRSGERLTYGVLIASPGIVYDYGQVPGLKEALEDPSSGVSSIYVDPKKTWSDLQQFKGGVALFTQPNTPIKCGGAPQKIMYLADSAFRKQGVRAASDVVFATPGGVIFGVKPIKETLMKVVNRKDINLRFGHQFVAIDAAKKVAWYKLGDNKGKHGTAAVKTIEEDGKIGIPYTILHTAPPSKAPAFLAESGLCNDSGWMNVDQYTLQHKEYPNIFGIGDAAALPTAKTGAAIRKQVPIVIKNIQAYKKGLIELPEKYNGYSSCPLITDYGKMVLAEFDYDSNFTPDPKLKWLFVFDSSKESWILWLLKKFGLPYLYWKKMMKGEEV